MLKQISNRLVETNHRQFEVRRMVSDYWVVYDLVTGAPVATKDSEEECVAVLNGLRPGQPVPSMPPQSLEDILAVVDGLCESFRKAPKLGKLSTRCLQAIMVCEEIDEIHQLAAAALDAQELED